MSKSSKHLSCLFLPFLPLAFKRLPLPGQRLLPGVRRRLRLPRRGQPGGGLGAGAAAELRPHGARQPAAAPAAGLRRAPGARGGPEKLLRKGGFEQFRGISVVKGDFKQLSGILIGPSYCTSFGSSHGAKSSEVVRRASCPIPIPRGSWCA